MLHVKGYGFVTCDGGGADRFLHVSDLVDSRSWSELREGDRLDYEPIIRPARGDKPPRPGVTRARRA